MTKPDAIITLCREYRREPTRRSWLAVSKALTALDVTDAERHELETRMDFRSNDELYPHLTEQPEKQRHSRNSTGQTSGDG